MSLLDRLVDNILADPGFLDKGLANNHMILEALVQGIGSLMGEVGENSCLDQQIKLVSCIRALELVCCNVPKVLWYKNAAASVLVSLAKLLRFKNCKMAIRCMIHCLELIATNTRQFVVKHRAVSSIAQLVQHYVDKAFLSNETLDLRAAIGCLEVFCNYKVQYSLPTCHKYAWKIVGVFRKVWFLLSQGAMNETAFSLQLSVLNTLSVYTMHCDDSVSLSKLQTMLSFCNDCLGEMLQFEPSPESQTQFAKIFCEIYLKCLQIGAQNVFHSTIVPLHVGNGDLQSAVQLCCAHPDSLEFSDPYLGQLKAKIWEYLHPESHNAQIAIETSSLSLPSDSASSLLQAINRLGSAACQISGHYDPKLNCCRVCEVAADSNKVKKLQQELSSSKEVSKIVRLFSDKIVSNDQVLNNDSLRISVLLALRKIFLKYKVPNISSQWGKNLFRFVTDSLFSKNRNVRVLAGKVVPLWVISEDSRIKVSENCLSILHFLDSELVLKPGITSYLAESKILIWGELATVLDGEILNVVLVKLFDFFSSTNFFYTCAAYTTLQQSASLKNQTCWQMVNPFLPNLSLTLVKQIVNKSVFGTVLPELLNVSGNDMMFRTIPYTVPYLLTYYSKDVIKEIATVAKTTKHELVLQQFPRVLAVLFTSLEYLDLDSDSGHYYINHSKIMEIFSIVDPFFKGKALQEFVDPVSDIWEISKMYSVDEANYLRIKNAVVHVIRLKTGNFDSELNWHRYNVSIGHKSDDAVLSDFFKGALLGIVQLFSEVVKDTKGRTPDVEKMKSLTAIEFLVQITGVEIVTALPQICISLQKTVADPVLEFQSLRCWKILIVNLKDIDLATCFDLIVAIILQRWRKFEAHSKEIAKEILFELFDKENLIREKYFNYYFTLSKVDTLEDVYLKASRILSKRGKETSSMVLNLLYDITRRCQNDNMYVVKQALCDLTQFMHEFRSEFHGKMYEKPHFANFVPILVTVLVKNCSKFESDIAQQCARCLAMIGSLDLSKRDESQQLQHTLVCDFSTTKELLQFIQQLLNQLLVKAFWASADPGKQIFLAYGMQEFLKLVGIRSASMLISKNESNSSGNKFSDLAISTLTPLTVSRYELSSMGTRQFRYPLFKWNRSHDDWVRDLTLDLLQNCRKRCQNNSDDSELRSLEQQFYSVYETIVKGQDIAISLTVLPFVALKTVINGNDDGTRDLVLQEVLQVLGTDCDSELFNLEVRKNIRLMYRTIFRILDFFREWIANKKQTLSKRSKRRGIAGSLDASTQAVEEFLLMVPEQLISQRSAQSEAYERAALYLEQNLRLTKNEASVESLKRIYEKLHDEDALAGLLAKFSSVSVDSAISEIQFQENWTNALSTFEALESQNPSTKSIDSELLRYLSKHKRTSDALSKLNSTNWVGSRMGASVLNLALETSMLETDFASLEKWMKISQMAVGNDNELLGNLSLSKALLACYHGDKTGFEESVTECYKLMGTFLALSPHGNRAVMDRLHVLRSLEDLCAVGSKEEFHNESQYFYEKLRTVGSDFDSPWYILTMRKTSEMAMSSSSLLSPGRLVNTQDRDTSLAKILLTKCQIEQEHNRLDLAQKSAVQAYLSDKDELAELRFAEIMWSQGQEAKALRIVQKLKEKSHNKEFQLKYAVWLEASRNGLGSEIVSEYKRAIELDPKSSEPYYMLGKYYSKVMGTGDPGYYERKIVGSYLNSLASGAEHLQEVLPKVVTLWLDLEKQVHGEKMGSNEESETAAGVQNLKLLENDIKRFGKTLPRHFWFTVFSQLLSRLYTIKSKETLNTAVDICMSVTQQYPEQALWWVFAQMNSDNVDRRNIGKKILKQFMQSECKLPKYKSNKTIYNSAIGLFSALRKISKVKFKVQKRLREPSLAKDFQFDHSVVPAPVVVPSKKNFDLVRLSSADVSSSVTLVKIMDTVKVMPSLQQPKRLEAVGSDGKTYFFLFKINDDLRKDAKLMDFTSMIDNLLANDYESRKRQLHVNTFAVVPMNESYGIIEWVPEHVTMKSAIDRKYENKESLLSVRDQYDSKKTMDAKMAFFQHLLQYYEPVLYHWFIEVFPTPSAWYASRNNFVRSSAVMCMVGHILGLGDRHGENILMSRRDGTVLHVDFDCLFEKGRILKFPERVPFRLTQNIVDACGVSGVEGGFRISSEVTMKLLRNNEPILLNILEAFLYDPIMEWKSNKLGTPETTLEKIRFKIRGILEHEALPMSVAGQVNYLIQEAVSVENLCRMYFGWLSFW